MEAAWADDAADDASPPVHGTVTQAIFKVWSAHIAEKRTKHLLHSAPHLVQTTQYVVPIVL
jgi:hypothetical protein